MDEVLRRRGDQGEFTIAALETLPNGTMVVYEDEPYLIKDGATFRWSFEGYKKFELGKEHFRVLTPIPFVNILRAGFSIDLP